MSKPAKRQSESTDKANQPEAWWPWLLRLSPGVVLMAVVGWLVFAWGVFIAIDIGQLFGAELNRPAWRLLFNDYPVEWSAWFVLAFATVSAAFLAGMLRMLERPGAAKFFFWLAVGLGLMLIEDAGDIRHTISGEVQRVAGDEVLGIHYRVFSDSIYFTLLAAAPVYAVLRYGKYAWQSVRSRWYLLSGVGLYAVAAIGSSVRHLGDFYIKIGAWLDGLVFGGGFPVPDGMSQERAHFLLVDSVLEESVELLAAALLLAAILAFASDVRSKRLAKEL